MPDSKKALSDLQPPDYFKFKKDESGRLYWNGSKVRVGGLSDVVWSAIIGGAVVIIVGVLTNWPNVQELWKDMTSPPHAEGQTSSPPAVKPPATQPNAAPSH
jgi:hypothetical protein